MQSVRLVNQQENFKAVKTFRQLNYNLMLVAPVKLSFANKKKI